jgi:hypothetical protein
MLQKCANPGCAVPFRSLHEGKLFVAETPASHAAGEFDGSRRKMPKREHFWLCGACSMHFTLFFDTSLGMLTIPLTQRAALRSPEARPRPRARASNSA